MRSNYHSIKAIINNSHGYSEMIHGITAYTQGLFRANVIKIKNTVVTKLRLGLKTKHNVIKISTKTVDTSLKIYPKITENNIIVKNNFLNKLMVKLRPSESNLKIVNTFWIYIAKISEIINEVKIKNDVKHNVAIPEKVKDNSIIFDGVANTSVSSVLRIANNDISIENPPVNSAAWYFLKLGNLSGTLGEIPNESIETLGRKKAI